MKLSFFLPQTDDPCGRVFYSNPTIDDWTNWISRVDYQVSPNHSLFGRYLRETRVQPVGYDLNQNLLATRNGVDGKNNAFTIGTTDLFGPQVVNTVRATYNRFTGGKTAADFSGCNCGNGHLGINSFFPTPDDLSFTVSGGGGFTLGAPRGPTLVNLYSFNDDVSVVKGNHQMSTGMVAGHYRVDSGSSNNTQYGFTFNGRTTGLGMSDFLLGKVSRMAKWEPDRTAQPHELHQLVLRRHVEADAAGNHELRRALGAFLPAKQR